MQTSLFWITSSKYRLWNKKTKMRMFLWIFLSRSRKSASFRCASTITPVWRALSSGIRRCPRGTRRTILGILTLWKRLVVTGKMYSRWLKEMRFRRSRLPRGRRRQIWMLNWVGRWSYLRRYSITLILIQTRRLRTCNDYRVRGSLSNLLIILNERFWHLINS